MNDLGSTDKPVFKVSVRKIAEFVLRGGDLETEITPPGRLREGIRVHRAVQASRPESYSPEVPVFHRLETDALILEIRGRIDGLDLTRTPPMVEEIKSTRGPFPDLPVPAHMGQLVMYAHMAGLAYDLAEVEGRLTLCRIDTGETRQYIECWTLDELASRFEEIALPYTDWLAQVADWQRRRDESIRALPFPHPAFHPGQREMAVAVFRTIRDGRQLLVQAPTGIGKTIGAFFPAIKALAENHASRIFYLTARTTGQQAAEKALREMRRAGLQLKSVTLTAREKSCLSPGSACNGEECAFARGYHDRIRMALTELFEQDRFTRPDLASAARTHRLCPFALSLDLLPWMDAVICDYNYVLDPRVFLKRFFQEAGARCALLIDEAHNLVDRSREMFSACLPVSDFHALQDEVHRRLPELSATIGRFIRRVESLENETGSEEGFPLPAPVAPELTDAVSTFVESTATALARNAVTDRAVLERLISLYGEAAWFLTLAHDDGDSHVPLVEGSGTNRRLSMFCRNPAKWVQQALGRGGSVVIFSATLSPSDYFKTLFGCEPDTPVVNLPSPFPPDRLGVFIEDTVSTYYRDRDRTRTALARLLHRFFSARKGNYLLFFPSHAYLQAVYDDIAGMKPDAEIIRQSPGMSEPDREAFISAFSEQRDQSLVGFGVMGGIFGEGIDLKGDRLTGAAVVGPGLPAISPERELIRRWFQERDGMGFEFAYLYPGIQRVCQAVGRVIRSAEDRGCVLLVDPRFSRADCRRLFPAHWRPARVRGLAHLEGLLKSFWNGENTVSGGVAD